MVGTGRWSDIGLFGCCFAAAVGIVQASCEGESRTVDRGERGGSGGAGGAAAGANAGGGSTGGARGGRGGTAQGGAAGTSSGEGGNGTGGTGTAGAEDGGAPAAGTGGEGSGRPVAGICDAPRRWSEGLERCRDGFVHRSNEVTCSVPVRDELVPGVPSSAGEEPECARLRPDGCRMLKDECKRDADCPNGDFCLRQYRDDGYEITIAHVCQTPCASDDACGAGMACVCDRVVQNATRSVVTLGTCRTATCRTDDDCGAGRLCISPLNIPLEAGFVEPELEEFHCQTDTDECHGPETCELPPDQECSVHAACVYRDGHLACRGRLTETLCF